MPSESPWVYLTKLWWYYRYLCITHIVVITIIKFFITPENASRVMYLDFSCTAIVFTYLVFKTRDPRTSMIIVIINSFVAPMITTVLFYPLLMALGQAFGF
jgi:hypothetical protein